MATTRNHTKKIAEVRKLIDPESEAMVVSESRLPKLSPEPAEDCKTADEKRTYTEIVLAHEGTGVLRQTDKIAVTLLATKMAVWRKLKARLFSGKLMETEEGLARIKDIMKEWRALTKDIESTLRSLGMTPEARERFLKDRSETTRNMKQAGFGVDFNSGLEE